MNRLLEQWDFLAPKGYLNIFQNNEEFSKQWMQIYYIARCLFSPYTTFPIKGSLAPLLERKEIFPKAEKKENSFQDQFMTNFNMANDLDISRITSLHQISQILPKEFIIYPEELFYLKLINKELCRKEFRANNGISVTDLVYGQDQEFTTKQKVYILFDNSSSMNGDRFYKLYVAKVICLEYLRRVQEETPQIYFRSFNQEVGPIVKAGNRGQVKDLIKHIIDLNTFDSFKTDINKAIHQAIADINSDPELQQAEILMISDGLGEIQADLKEQLGKIKLHVVFIPSINMDEFLKLFPDLETWKKAKIKEGGVANMSLRWTNFSQVLELYFQAKHIYSLQEITNLFIKIPPLTEVHFSFSDTHELDQIRDLRIELANKLENPLSNSEKYEIYQKIRFIINYLGILLSQEPPKEIKKRIKIELSEIQNLLKKLTKDEWFSFSLETTTSISNGSKKPKGINEEYSFALKGEGNHQSVLIGMLLLLIRLIGKIPDFFSTHINEGKEKIKAITAQSVHRQKMRKKFRFLEKKISELIIAQKG